MATTRLKIYNGALLICRERSLSSLSENQKGRHLLDEVWNDGGVRYCLERGQWRFAMRTQLAQYDPAVTPQFGLRRAFPKPTDWIDTSAVCQDEYFKSPLLNYADEVGYWFADLDEIYVKFVSDDTNYGANLANWPVSFTEYVKAHFAAKICGSLCSDAKLVEAITKPKSGIEAQALLTARNRDAMAGPTTYPARGMWVRSREGSRSAWGDRGNRNSLIG